MSSVTKSRDTTWLDRLPAIATIIVAVTAGVLAANATASVAVTTGAVSDPRLAWGLPLIVEGGAVVSGLLAWRRVRAGQGAWPERLALFALSLLAVVVNASHAAGGSWLGVVLAACPPLVLVTSNELLLRNRGATEAEQEAQAAVETTERERIAVERAKAEAAERRAERTRERAAERARERAVGSASAPPVTCERPSLAAVDETSTSAMSHDERVAEALAWFVADGVQKEGAVAERFGVSRATGGRIRRDAKQRLAVEISA